QVVGYRGGARGWPVDPARSCRLPEGGRGQSAGLGSASGLGRDATHVVDGLARAPERSPPQLCVLLAVSVHTGPALCRVGLVGGGPSVQLVEGTFPEHGDHGGACRSPQALVELEVGVTASGYVERRLEATDLLDLT